MTLTPSPRLPPGGRSDLGWINATIVRLMGLVLGTSRPAIFATLGRHRRLFRRWLIFAGALMPAGTLPRADTELVILRVARNCDCPYERAAHRGLARGAGLEAAQIAAV